MVKKGTIEVCSQSIDIGIDIKISLQWRHNGRDGVSNHQPHHCLLNRLFRRRSKKISKLRVTGLCAGNSPVTGEFSAQRVRNAENVSIWWRHHVTVLLKVTSRIKWRRYIHSTIGKTTRPHVTVVTQLIVSWHWWMGLKCKRVWSLWIKIVAW